MASIFLSRQVRMMRGRALDPLRVSARDLIWVTVAVALCSCAHAQVEPERGTNADLADTLKTGPQTGMVRTVTDGDTFRLTSGERIRIADIDAPETWVRQARCPAERVQGEAAKQRLEAMIEGKAVQFVRVGRSYDRTVATVRFSGRDLATTLTASGSAAWWPRGRPKPGWCRSAAAR